MGDFIKRVKKLSGKEDSKNEILADGGADSRIVLASYENSSISDIVNINNEYIDFFISHRSSKDNPKALIDTSIECWKLFFKILSIIKSKQFQIDKQPRQLELFKEEFKAKENSYVSITMKTTDVNEHRNRKRIRTAIDELQENFTQWVTLVNSKGEKVDSKLSLIEKPSFTRGKIYFETSIFWYEKFVALSHYNDVLYSLPFNLSNTKQLFFALYIEKLPEAQWTTFTLSKLNEILDLNYEYTSHLAHSFLVPLAASLNSFNSKSFNIKTDSNYIYIRPFHIKDVQKAENSEGIPVTDQTKFQLKIKYQIKYFKDRHKFDEHTAKHLKDIYNASSINFEVLQNAYTALKKQAKSEKRLMTEYIGNEFLTRWQAFIKDEYQKTETGKKYPNGFPSII